MRTGVTLMIGLGVFVGSIPAAVGIPLAIVAFLLTSAHVAFRVHDRNQSHEDTSSIDLRS